MADSEEPPAWAVALQAKVDHHALTLNQSFQQLVHQVDSRIEEFRILLPGSPGFASASGFKSESHCQVRRFFVDYPFHANGGAEFDGSDPTGWIFRITEFFDLHGTPDAVRLRIVSFHMKGRAAAWFQWMKANRMLTTWAEFLRSLKHRFGDSLYDDPQGTLSKLTQTASVAEFQSAFEDLMNKSTESVVLTQKTKKNIEVCSYWCSSICLHTEELLPKYEQARAVAIKPTL